MIRHRLWLISCGCCLSLATGCAHLVESRVIQAFAESLQKEDLAALREESSAEFESKALNRDDALASFKLVGVPEGKPKVIKVEDDGDEKRVTVEVGEKSNKRKLLYRLTRDEQSNQWVVDDIFLNRKELAENKSVSEQVNLLLSLREFLDAWEKGDRAAVLSATTAEFRQPLGELPPRHLAQLTKRLTAEIAEQDKIRPDANIGEESAEVRLPKLNGELIVIFRKAQDRWKADEVKVESTRDGENTPSVREVAAATSAALAFQTAYNSSDKRTLSRVCTPRFFDGSLAAANLSMVKLPVKPQTAGEEFEVKLDGRGANFVVQGEREVLKVSLAKQEQEKPSAPPQYRVDEVTIYEMQGRQDKRLSALFTSHALMRIFSEALIARDLETLRHSSAHDFNQRVWDRVTPASIVALPLNEIHAGEPEVLNTVFQGPLTQITVDQGQGPLTYVLRDYAGKMLIDDVLVPPVTHPESLKTTLELMLPVIDFSAGLRMAISDMVRENSSREFNRLVWNQLDGVPELEPNPQNFLRLPLSKMSQVAERALVVLGDERHGAQVFLIRERDRYVVDDVLLIHGPESQQRIALKRTLRVRLAEGQ